MNVKQLDYVVASHQDPDIVASVNKWLVGTDCKGGPGPVGALHPALHPPG